MRQDGMDGDGCRTHGKYLKTYNILIGKIQDKIPLGSPRG
jgi:hypothetical protein